VSEGENSASGTDSKGRTIKVEVTLNEEIKKLMKEKIELEQKLEGQEGLALELFDAKKNEAIRNFPAYAKVLRECTTPETLQKFIDVADSAQSKEGIVYGTAPENKQVVAGKAMIGFTGQGGEQFESRTALIDSLYNKGYYHSKDFTAAEAAEAREKIDALFKTLIDSKSMQELKNRHGALGEMMRKHTYGECPKCHSTLVDSNLCQNPECKYDASDPEKNKEGYVISAPDWDERKEADRIKRRK
jgi:hypothetical protein